MQAKGKQCILALTATMRLATASKDARLALRSVQSLLHWVDSQLPPSHKDPKGGKAPPTTSGGHGGFGWWRAAGGGEGGAYPCPASVACCLHQLAGQVVRMEVGGWRLVGQVRQGILVD